MFQIKSFFSFRKSKKILRQGYSLYKRKRKRLTDIQKNRIENTLLSLQTAITKKDRKAAHRAARNLEKLSSQFFKKTFFEQTLDVVFALAFALIVAIVVRQMWFEFYTIPTGSMRPTLKEKDFIVVSKTDFGINVPLKTSHLYFDQNLVNRGGIVIFSGANMDIHDVNMMYFYLFPGKKQFVKRLIAKPGDSLYFYGGQIYGIDSKGNDIKELREDPWFKKIEHIPFIRFEGKIKTNSSKSNDIYSPVTFYQMNEPIAKLSFDTFGKMDGNLIYEDSNVFTKNTQIQNYYDIWGFKNFAMARILTKAQVLKVTNLSFANIDQSSLYLQLTHHPTLEKAKMIRDEYGRLRPAMSFSQSIIPLEEKHLKTIFKALYTARFIVKDGYAKRYGVKTNDTTFLPKLDIPDGTYEFYDGIASKVNIAGILTKLPLDHSIYDYSPQRVQTLFNLGIEFNTIYSPRKKYQTLIPSRYSYFRNKNLYLMGHPIFKKDDPVLVNFLNNEHKKQMSDSAYHPFEDLGPPIDENGKINKELIKRYGIVIPEKMYLVLGDNHAMSADSRDFGFVPENNLRGGASLIFWPPSNRFGLPLQAHYKLWSFPKLTIWILAIIIIILSFYFIRKRTKKPFKF